MARAHRAGNPNLGYRSGSSGLNPFVAVETPAVKTVLMVRLQRANAAQLRHVFYRRRRNRLRRWSLAAEFVIEGEVVGDHNEDAAAWRSPSSRAARQRTQGEV